MRILDSIDDALIQELRQKQEFFWLDITAPTKQQVEHLGSLLALHPLAVEDSVKFGQRPKLDIYGSTALLVLQGAVGYTQYFTGLPWGVVLAHMLLATLLVVALVRAMVALRTTDDAPTLHP